MPKPEVIRAPGYLCLCGGVVAALLAISIGAFLYPSVKSADPDWMFWPWALALLAPLLRAPFVGVVVHDDHLVRRTWLRSVTLPRSEIIDVETTRYSGLLNGDPDEHHGHRRWAPTDQERYDHQDGCDVHVTEMSAGFTHVRPARGGHEAGAVTSWVHPARMTDHCWQSPRPDAGTRHQRHVRTPPPQQTRDSQG